MYGKESEAVCNEYQLDMTDLKILNLDNYGPLALVAELICNRGTISENTEEVANFIQDMYKLPTENADIIKGYRAIGNYPKIVDSFLKNEINLDELSRLFKKGNLGEQIFVKSQKAFAQLHFMGYDKIQEEHPLVKEDVRAKTEVLEFLNKRKSDIETGLFKPSGILAKDLTENYFKYDKENGYCFVSDYEEMEEPEYEYLTK